MSRILTLLLAAGLVAGPVLAEPASAQQRRSEQGEARREMSAGNILELRDIEAVIGQPQLRHKPLRAKPRPLRASQRFTGENISDLCRLGGGKFYHSPPMAK